MEVQFEGLDELVSRLEQVGNNIQEGKSDALQAGGKVMQDETKKTVGTVLTRRTDTLYDNVELSEVEGDEIYVYVDQQGVAYYGYFHEVGTSKMPARPFMGPAFNRSRFKIQQAMADSLRQRLGL